MRRTVGLSVVAATVLALAGVAGAQTVDRRPEARGVTEVAGDLIGGLGAAVPGLGLGRTGSERVGALESVSRLLGAPGQPRTTTLRYPGARYVKVRFSPGDLDAGDRVTVSDPTGTEVHRYDARSLAARADGWTMSVTGDTAVVTARRGTVRIDQVARGLSEREIADNAERERTAREAAEPGRTGREESVCGGDDKSDAVCYRSADPATYRRSKAVVRLLIRGTELCTGWRLGPDNRVVTNNHCFADSRSAYGTEVWFNYQCATCGGWEVFRPTKVWGDRVLLTDRTLDLTVFTVENFEHVRRFGHLTLEQRPAVAGEEVLIPQHPAGQPNMIAANSDEDRSGTCAVVDPAYDGYAPNSDVSYYCDTEGGSSGSPVLSRRTGRVIALHHFGGCPNSGVRADLIHGRIRHLL